MAETVKLILPLMSEEIPLEDISEDTGFVCAYTEDKNRPSLRNHIFLMYKANFLSLEFCRIDDKFRNYRTLYSRKCISINGEMFMLYTFVRFGKTIEDILEGILPYKDDEYLKIHKYWKFKDDFINKLLCDRSYLYKIDDPEAIVPEMDYIPEEDETE